MEVIVNNSYGFIEYDDNGEFINSHHIGLDGVCPYCNLKLINKCSNCGSDLYTDDNVMTWNYALESAPNKRYWYIAHKGCYVNANREERDAVANRVAAK